MEQAQLKNKKREISIENKSRKFLANYLNGLQLSSLHSLYYTREKTFSPLCRLRKFYVLAQNMAADDIADIVDKIYRRRHMRIEQNLTYKEKINKHLGYLAEYLPTSGYKMGEMKYIHLNNKFLTGSHNATREYGYWSYRANHGRVEVTLNNSYRNAQIIGGVITLIKCKTKYNGVYQAEWLDFEKCAKYIKSSGDIKVKIVHGYIYKTFHATKLSEIFDFKNRERILDKNRKKAEKNRKKAEKKALNKMYKLSDSLSAGNCRVGSLNFCRRFGLDENKEYKGKYLISLVNGDEQYLKYLYRFIK